MAEVRERQELKMRATIKNWSQFCVGELNIILRAATESMIKEMQKAKPSKHKLDRGAVNVTGGRLPVDTGALRASLISEIDGGVIAISKKTGDGVRAAAKTAIKKFSIGETATFGWTVHYAEYQEFGHKNATSGSFGDLFTAPTAQTGLQGNLFMTTQIKRWQHFVNLGVVKAKLARNRASGAIGALTAGDRPIDLKLV